MKVNGIPTRTLRKMDEASVSVIEIIDQTALPHCYQTRIIRSLEEAAHAIRSMQVRGAPLIGVTAAYGVALAMQYRSDQEMLARALALLGDTRPTAVNLHWALRRMEARLSPLPAAERKAAAWQEAALMAEEDVAQNRAIGDHGLGLLKSLTGAREGRLNIMTHCNAGWLATVDYGTALAPIYAAHDAGIEVCVWVSETRPRNQGLLTAWELQQHGVPLRVIADNAAGHLLMRGQIDAVIVGADRIAANGDVANKVGTSLKALAAREAGVPFYVAAPCSTLDFACPDGLAIPIEERDGEELRTLHGEGGSLRQLAAEMAVANPAFDVTPARHVSAIITERGVCSPEALRSLYPEGV